MGTILINNGSFFSYLSHHTDFKLLQISQTSVYKLRRSARRSSSKILHIQQHRLHPTCRCIQQNPCPCNSSTNHQHIELFLFHLLQKLLATGARKRMLSHIPKPPVYFLYKKETPYTTVASILAAMYGISYFSITLMFYLFKPDSISLSDGLSVSVTVTVCRLPSR
ncbi:hypothetical protein D3C75_766530 [compost metagenome]